MYGKNPGLISSYQDEVTERKMGKDSYNQPLWGGHGLTPAHHLHERTFGISHVSENSERDSGDWQTWNPTVTMRENMSKSSVEPQRWGPGTGSEVNPRDQVAKPRQRTTPAQRRPASLMPRGWASLPESGRERRGEQKHLMTDFKS